MNYITRIMELLWVLLPTSLLGNTYDCCISLDNAYIYDKLRRSFAYEICLDFNSSKNMTEQLSVNFVSTH